MSTALSHRRAFVVEVMGRKCGWLALMTAMATGSHYVFIPERPPPFNRKKYGRDWQSELCDTITESRKLNNYRTIVILSEGAVDLDLNPIKSTDVAKALSEKLGVDTRLTFLGHVQRGGKPCAYDRYLATIQGVKAVDVISSSIDKPCSVAIGIEENNKLKCIDLSEAIKLNKILNDLFMSKNFEQVFLRRGNMFSKIFEAFLLTCRRENILMEIKHIDENDSKPYRVGIVTVGAPAGGINSAIRIAVRLILKNGWTPFGIKNGLYGLSKGQYETLDWAKTIGMQAMGGSILGTSRFHPRPLHDSPVVYPNAQSYVECGMLAYNMTKMKLDALIILGGFEALTSQLILTDARRVFPAFRIPIVGIPATISNNFPCTQYSIGCDTALNVIVEACDRIKVSAETTRERLYIIEVQGKYCGYLAAVAGMTSGASKTYIPETGVTLDKLCHDFDFIKQLASRSSLEEGEVSAGGKIILISDGASKTYTSSLICTMFKEYLENKMDIKPIVLGHLQQGGIPSPFDRLFSTILVHKAIEILSEYKMLVNSYNLETFPLSSMSSVVGGNNSKCHSSNIYDVISSADLKHRRPKHPWWLHLNDHILSLNRYLHDDYNSIKKSYFCQKPSTTQLLNKL